MTAMVLQASVQARVRELHALMKADLRSDVLTAAREVVSEFGSASATDVVAEALLGVSQALIPYGSPESLEYIATLVRLRRSEGEPLHTAAALNCLACTLVDHGRFVEAFQTFDEALSLYRTSGNSVGVGRCLYNRACALESMGRDADAEHEFRVALQMYQAAGYRYGVTLARNGLALLMANSKREEESELLFRLVLQDDAISGLLRKSVQANLALLRSRRGEVHEALSDFTNAYPGIDVDKPSELLVSELGRYGELLSNAGFHERAIACLHAAVERGAVEGRRLHYLSVLETASQVYERAGLLGDALALLRQHNALRSAMELETARLLHIDTHTSRRLIQADILIQEFPVLARSEASACVLFAEGHSTKNVARELHLAVRSVETIRQRSTKKLGLPSSAGLDEFVRAKLQELYTP